MRKLLLFFAMLCVSVGTWAAITITPATDIWIGGTTYSGYGIYGAKEGELAQLLNGTYTGTVQWNGASLDQLKSAVLIKVGSSSSPNVLGNDDLEALQQLSGARFLDIDGSQLAASANISSIKAGPNIEAVTLPNQLTKEQVNAAGAALKTCNSNFGSCMSLDAEMEEKEIRVFIDPCTSAEVEYTGTETGSTVHLTSITRPLTEAGSTFSYINTKFRDELSYCDMSEVSDGKCVPNPLKVELTKLATPKTSYQIEYNGQTIPVPSYAVNTSTNPPTVSQEFNCAETNWQNTVGLTGKEVTVVTVEYTYTMRDWQSEVSKDYIGTPLGDETNGYYAMVENVYSPQYGYQFDVTATYNYTYTDPTDTENPCSVKTASYTDGPHSTIDIPCDMDVALTAKTVNVPVPGKNVAVAYVNTPGSLYQSVSLDVNDASTVEGLIISGNINNADISVHEGAGDPNASQNDDDAFTSTGATPAFYVNNKQATIKSVDMSDAVIDDYKHLRVLNAYGSNLESVVFPKTVTRIPNYCCYSMGNSGNQNLSEIVFPTEAATLEIGDYAFHHCAVVSLLFPSSTTSVGNYAFATSPNMTDVEMQGLTNNCTFGNNVFDGCGALKHVTLSEKTQNIGDNMFNQCGLLESIRIPTTCKTIGEKAFCECYSVHEITIPEGVELIKVNAFDLSGLTDIYVMATSPDKVPKIYAQSPTGDGPATFSYQRTTGNNTVPTKDADEWVSADYDEVMSWYQEELSGPKGLGTGNSLVALHYPESMKPFYEGIDITQVYSAEELTEFVNNGLVNYFTPDEYLAFISSDATKAQVQGDITNRRVEGTTVTEYEATRLTDPETHEELPLLYLPQTYAIDPYQNGSNPLQGPDADNRYYPAQSDFVVRMAAGATGTNSGATDGIASQWGWRQFPLSSSVEEIGEIPFQKEYDDTWYTMCFPWQMIDNQLFSAFNQKCEIVEFKGAEMVKQDDETYNLVFHFDDVAATYYMDADGVEYSRERDGDKVDAAGHNLYIYTSKDGNNTVVSCPDEVLASGYNPKNASDAVKEAYGKYLSIQNVMVKPGHPYMIHPSIGANPGNPATVYINGVKKIEVGEGKEFASYEAMAEKQKVNKKVAEISKTGEPVAEVWETPDGKAGGSYTFIGNINDDVDGDLGKKDMPLPCYFLGVKSGTVYPKYYRRTTGGVKKWSQYSAIIIPDEAAKANIEKFMSSSSTSTSTGAKEMGDVVFGEWEVVDAEQMATVIDNAVAEGKEKNEPAKIQHLNVVYNIKGQVVRSNSTSVEGLPKGLYIVNGKKYMVK